MSLHEAFSRDTYTTLCAALRTRARAEGPYRYSSAGRGAGSGVWGTSWAGLYLGLCDVGIPIGETRVVSVCFKGSCSSW